MVKGFVKIYVVLLVALTAAKGLYAQQPIPPDSLKPMLNATDTVDKQVIYTPTATFSNIKLLKEEVAKIGIGNAFACQGYYGIFYMCELQPYTVGLRNYNGRSTNIQYKISGNDSTKANLILISAEIQNPDYKNQALDVLVNTVRKTLNMLGEQMPENLRYNILSMLDYRGRTDKGYTLKLTPFRGNIEAIELRIDATGMD